jgi:PHD/YefM family antitoxin component YafN of YafNO toxin-antitoxin module
MSKTISATEAARKFSDLLKTITFKGARYTMLRNGKPGAGTTSISDDRVSQSDTD